jgi:Alkaline and neutral invertase
LRTSYLISYRIDWVFHDPGKQLPMKRARWLEVEAARQAALAVLVHNVHGPFMDLPRTAGWGYPEPYTRDLMFGALGIMASDNAELIKSVRVVLVALAHGQTAHGHIPSLASNPNDLGASDTTPLFLIGLAVYRQAMGQPKFLAGAASKALTWLEYQSPSDRLLIAQQPTSDWRDEQWVMGYGLYVNTLTYLAYKLHHLLPEAAILRRLINTPLRSQGLAIPGQPYYALWVYKSHSSSRFDLLGNCLAILSGLTSQAQARQMVGWIETQCQDLRTLGLLNSDLPPCFFPYINPKDSDWLPRYGIYNLPGQYHNGGIWPFICALYVAALVAARQFTLAEQKLYALTQLVRPARNRKLAYGFNEWFRAQDGSPQGQDWQSWSASLYLYAVAAVEQRRTPFFEQRH